MFQVRSLIRVLVTLAFISAPVSAQALEGTFGLNGVQGNWTIEFTLIMNPPETYIGIVKRNGVEVPRENMVVNAVGGGAYEWLNNSGNTGTITPNDDGTFTSTVTSGPNSGHSVTLGPQDSDTDG